MTMRKAGCLVLTAALLSCAALPAVAGVTNSLHDFSGKGFAPDGACSACHRAHHASETKGLWSRDLSQEEGSFDQVSSPDYLPGGTLLCYDCHVDYLTSGSGATPDNDPPHSAWSSGKEPQDIAFTDGSGPGVGYYELKDGAVPGTPPPPGSPTGGHYWKSEPSGTPDYAMGDKLPCTMCHDPHDKETGSNEAMFRTSTPDGAGGTVDLGDGHRASSNSRNGGGDGRDMCAACHGYADGGAPVVLWGVTLPAPPASISNHLEAATGGCTDCHRHNYVSPGSVSCENCHHSGGPGPNVMGDGSDSNGTGTIPKPYDDGTWGFNVNGHGANGTASHTPGSLNPGSACTDCHDISDPAGGAGGHNNGTLNSSEQGLNTSTNTAHLIGAFINSAPGSDYDVQLTFDGACAGLCHGDSGTRDMRHSLSNPVTNVMEFGLMSTVADGEAIGWPIDVDITTHADGGASPPDVDYGLCVSCHNPHGTNVVEPSKATNRMVRGQWITHPSSYCGVCHL